MADPWESESVADQMARSVYRGGVWYRRENGKPVEWPVLRLDRLAAQDLNRDAQAYQR